MTLHRLLPLLALGLNLLLLGVALAPDSDAARLKKLKDELAEARRQYSEQYPEVIRLRTAIAAIERESAPAAANRASERAVETAPGTAATRFARQALAGVETELKGLKEEESSLRNLIAGHEARVDGAANLRQDAQQPSLTYDSVKLRLEREQPLSFIEFNYMVLQAYDFV